MALNTEDKNTAKAIARGVGEELRLIREGRGWSRAKFVKRLPSGIGDRTLLAYEHGLRQLTIVRLIELSEGLEVGSPIILGQALQRAQLTLQSIPLRVDLRQLLATTDEDVRSLRQWARYRMKGSANGVVEVMPQGLRELAASVGLDHLDVAARLARFIPSELVDL